MNAKTAKLIRKFVARSVPSSIEHPERIRGLLTAKLKKTWNSTPWTKRKALRNMLKARANG